jgi:hypothetical protein
MIRLFFYPCVKVTELVESIQVDLTRLKPYFTANKLTLSALNKKLPDKPPLFYGTSPIKWVNEVKYIGL